MTIVNQLAPTITLAKGSHASFEQGACLLEGVSYVAGESFTDSPQCASKILGAFGRSLNDVLPDEKRQRLVPLVPLIVGTAGDGFDQERGLMAADWLIRVYTPTWLRLANLDEAAVSLESLPRQASWDDVEAAVPVVREAKRQAVAAGDAAWDAARVAARVAAWALAANAARVASGAAAGAAARVKLQPTVDLLQDSAIQLFEQMVTLGRAA